MLDSNSIPPQNLEIEITESIMIDSAGKALECVRDAKNMGIKVAIDDFYNLRKDVEAIMSENYSFFENLNDISQIFILGHSFSSIDQPYFDKIIKSIDLDRVSFIASYYSDEDYSKATQFFSDHGINKYRLVKLEDLMIHKQKQLSIDFPEEIHI